MISALMGMQGREASATKEAIGGDAPEKKVLIRRADGNTGRSGAQSPQPLPQPSGAVQGPQTPQQLLLEVQSVLRKGVPALSRLGGAGAIVGVQTFCRNSFGPLALQSSM